MLTACAFMILGSYYAAMVGHVSSAEKEEAVHDWACQHVNVLQYSSQSTS